MSDEAVVGIRSVLHPTDFSEASRLAFAHALRIALSGRTRMDILHADSGTADEPDWNSFPAVRQTLADWGVIEQGSSPEVVFDRLGVRLAKIGVHDRDAVRAILRFLDQHPSDLIVLATHGREGLPRWLHGSVAEPVARAAHASTLFIPHGARGCVAPESGAVTLRRILVPVDRRPAPGRALTAAAQTASLLADAPVALELLYVGEAGDMPELQIDQPPAGRRSSGASAAATWSGRSWPRRRLPISSSWRRRAIGAFWMRSAAARPSASCARRPVPCSPSRRSSPIAFDHRPGALARRSSTGMIEVPKQRRQSWRLLG